MAKCTAKEEPRLQSVHSMFKSFIDCLIDDSLTKHGDTSKSSTDKL